GCTTPAGNATQTQRGTRGVSPGSLEGGLEVSRRCTRKRFSTNFTPRPVGALSALVASGVSLAGASSAEAQTRAALSAPTTTSAVTTQNVTRQQGAGALAADLGVVEPIDPSAAGGYRAPAPAGPEADAGCSVPTLEM